MMSYVPRFTGEEAYHMNGSSSRFAALLASATSHTHVTQRSAGQSVLTLPRSLRLLRPRARGDHARQPQGCGDSRSLQRPDRAGPQPQLPRARATLRLPDRSDPGLQPAEEGQGRGGRALREAQLHGHDRRRARHHRAQRAARALGDRGRRQAHPRDHPPAAARGLRADRADREGRDAAAALAALASDLVADAQPLPDRRRSLLGAVAADRQAPARCGESQVVAWSCKRRGFCPSCIGRRMSDSAAHLVVRTWSIRAAADQHRVHGPHPTLPQLAGKSGEPEALRAPGHSEDHAPQSSSGRPTDIEEGPHIHRSEQ
jgi:hypothetical protein